MVQEASKEQIIQSIRGSNQSYRTFTPDAKQSPVAAVAG
jgi:hypothetical protein